MFLWLSGISLFFLLAFLVLYKVKRVSLWPSMMLTLFLLSLMVGLGGYLSSNIDYQSANLLNKVLIVLLVAILFLVFVCGIYILIAVLLLNARIVLTKERRTLANSLTLILGIGLIGYVLVATFVDTSEFPMPVQIFLLAVYVLIAYYTVHVAQFLIAALLCNLSLPHKNQDYIIIHGSGLVNGDVTPLLAGRIDKAIAFYRKQKAVHSAPKLIVSGGQGADEPRSEAEAMKEYVMAQGVPESDILLEDQSATTLENMKFSKRIMDQKHEGRAYNCIYATSDYHVLRTGIYARKAGLKINGIGSKTALYYLPSALIREYIAYIVIYWKWNLALVSLIFLGGIGLSVLWFVNQ